MAKNVLIYFDLFQEKLDDHQPNRKQKYFRGGLIFQGPRLSLHHFGQQAPESPVSSSGFDEYPLPDPTRTFFLLPEPDPNYFS